MRRRQFIAGLGSTAAWPAVARAQESGRIRLVGVLRQGDWENDPVRKFWASAFMDGLAKLGWSQGRNLRVEVRWNSRTSEQAQLDARALVDLKPDVLAAGGARLVRALQEQTRTIPIVMTGAGDPLAQGLVASLSRPEGNTTGVTDIFPSIAGKWVELLKACAPNVARVALIFSPDTIDPVFLKTTEAAAIDAGAQSGVRAVKMPVRNVAEIERAITDFAAEPNGGLIMVPPSPSGPEREAINRLALRHRLPTVYQDRTFAAEGGLLSYGADMIEVYRTGASYVDRILRGAKPGDLPVQFPTKFISVVNLKTAKAIGLDVSPSVLLRADEVIE
jgi:putative tryptophan/tyrosine transport system substrate-binding protein